MAIVRPFQGMRFTEAAGSIGELCCPPYDVLSAEEKKAYLKANPNNIIKLESPGTRPSDYKKAKKTLDEWLESGILKIDETPSFYIYEEVFSVDGQEYSLKGVIGKVFLYDFERGIILPHEHTFSSAKEDRFNLIQETACNFSPIYSLYDDESGAINKSIGKLSDREPDAEFTDADGVTHRLWATPRNTEVDRISANMAGKKLYIADGHHRYETALRYKNALLDSGKIDDSGENEADYVMMMLVDMQSDGLLVFPTHRVIRSLNKFSVTKFITASQEYFDVATTKSFDTANTKLKQIYEKGEKGICMFDGKKYYLLRLKNSEIMKELMPELSNVSRLLDVNILHKLILEKLMGIGEEQIADESALTYTRSSHEAVSLVESGEAKCCFLLNPTRVEEIGNVAKENEKMPRKSTYFYPKLTTGLVMNKLDIEKAKTQIDESEKKADYVAPELEFIET